MISFTKKFSLVFTAILITFLTGNNFSSAQSLPLSASGKNIVVEMTSSPTNPTAGDKVNLELSSYTANIDSLKIQWLVDGSIKQEGVGMKTFSITAKSNGQNTNVKAIVSANDGSSGTTEINILPAEVDLIVENQSFTPPFYKGGTYFTNQGAVKIIAMPNILGTNSKKIDSKNLVFKWTKDDTVIGSSSGTGKDSVIINGSVPITDIRVGVNIYDLSGNELANRSMILTAKDPQILFYENSPIYGILFNRAVTNYYLGTREQIKITAEPFYYTFLNGNRDSDAQYSWTVNQNSVTPTGNENEILLKQDNNGVSGIASISLTIDNLSKIFQYGDSSFNVQFGQ